MGGLRPLWAVALTDELTLRRLESGRAISRAVREGRSIVDIPVFGVPRPKVILSCERDAFTVAVVDEPHPDQLLLGGVAAALRSVGWVVSNDYDRPSVTRVLTQLRNYGAATLRPGRHWFLRRYRSPILVALANQTYKNGLQTFLEQNASNAPIELGIGELSERSMRAIGGSLASEEAHEYFKSRR